MSVPAQIGAAEGALQLSGAAGHMARVALPAGFEGYAGDIAMALHDAVTAAHLNRSRFRLKLHAAQTGDANETFVRAEYERTDMVPVVIWVAQQRGDAAALAAVLRPALAQYLPEFYS